MHSDLVSVVILIKIRPHNVAFECDCPMGLQQRTAGFGFGPSLSETLPQRPKSTRAIPILSGARRRIKTSRFKRRHVEHSFGRRTRGSGNLHCGHSRPRRCTLAVAHPTAKLRVEAQRSHQTRFCHAAGFSGKPCKMCPHF